ncbi:Hypothetical predicted protein [Marmota monax]|uniref:Uncharacterized protein n=1 Tax=Marmota monax TaxID=9995 RepID=A0A5E4A6S2_MARMO|nr:Hypothetical predicted protein [Marmota monax]
MTATCLSLIYINSTTVPKMLVNLQTQSQAISFEGCIMQMHFFIVFASLENFHLAVMAYDHFVAHLSPPALHSHHEPPALHVVGCGVLDPECPACPVTKLNGVATVLLHRLGNPPLFL